MSAIELIHNRACLSNYLFPSQVQDRSYTVYVAFATPLCHVLCITWFLSIKSLIKNPLRIVILLLYSNEINSLNSEQDLYSIQLKTCLKLIE